MKSLLFLCLSTFGLLQAGTMPMLLGPGLPTLASWNGTTVGGSSSNISKLDMIVIGTSTGNYKSWNGLASPSSGGALTATTKTAGNFSTTFVTSITATWGSNPAAGESVSCSVGGLTSALTYAVADSASNSYTAEGSQFSYTGAAGTIYAQNFHFFNLGGSISTVTFTPSSTSSHPFIACGTATDTGSGPSTDGSCSGSAGSVTNVPCSSAITTTAADWVFCGADGNNNLSVGSGFTQGYLASSNNIMTQYLVQGSSGSITPAVTLASSASGGLVCSAYKP